MYTIDYEIGLIKVEFYTYIDTVIFQRYLKKHKKLDDQMS